MKGIKLDDKMIDWLIDMAVFWTYSFLLYLALINSSLIAWWILGSLVVLRVFNYIKGALHDTDN